MGSGCSSPLRRLGGKRTKTARKDSSLFEFDGSNQQDSNLDTRHLHQPGQSQSQSGKGAHKHKFILENEITIQSDVINEDHPSTASYCTDGKNHNEEQTKISEHSVSLDPSRPYTDQSAQTIGNSSSSTAAKIMGLNGSYTPHDRHLLVSPALSPAPSSTCYSPPPASSNIGCIPTILDLNDLNEAFKTLTFGLADQKPGKRIQQPVRQQSELLNNHYTQHLVQTQNDLIKSISVIFITSDNFQCFNSSNNPEIGINTKVSTDNSSANHQASINAIETLANHIEANLKLFCDENLFNLRFLNLSHRHLSEHFHISNLLDASMNILEREYHDNSQRIIVIVLSNINDHSGGIGSIGMVPDGKAKEQHQQHLDRRQLPSKIEAQFMNKLLAANTVRPDISNAGEAHDLLKRWYNQIGNIFHLKPIYIIYPKILGESKDERDGAWKCWLDESSSIIKFIDAMRETDPDLASAIKLKTLFGSHIDFIMKEPTLQKRTLLIRNYSQLAGASNLSNQQQPAYSMVGLNELARLLADPNKLSLKRSMNYDEFIRTLNDWVSENFSKFLEAILENQIVQGKHVPPFIDRNLFIELTRQRYFLEHHLDNITESYEAKCASFYTNQISHILNDVVCGTRNLNTQPSPDCTPSDQQSSTATSVSQLTTNHLVFISGPKGCGKSTLFAQIIRLAVPEFLNKVQIIYRFCGLTLDSLSPNRLLRSICEQFCQTQGENITAASYIYSNRKEIMNALNKIIKLQASLIFLDALDCIDQSTSELDLDWLCEIGANPRIKIFIMLDSDSNLYKRVLSSYSDATHISLDNPSLSEWGQMLTATARSKRFNSTANFYDEIEKLTSSASALPNLERPSLNLTYLDVGNIMQMCRIRRLNNEFIYPELSSSKLMENNSPIQNLKNVQQNILSHLQYLLSPYQICTLFVAFDSSRNGLSESDLINIMTMISQSSKAAAANAELKFSSALLNYIMIQLEPWLISILCDKMVKITVQKGFTAKVIEHYISIYPTIVNEIRESLLDYFSSQTRLKSSKGNIKGELIGVGTGSNTSETRESLSSAETLWLATQASEYVHLMILTNPSKARDHILNKQQFFLQFLYGKMPEEFIEDYNRLKDLGGKKSSSSGTTDDLQILVNYIRQSIHPLRYDGSQIYSQIYCRAYELIKTGKLSKSKKLNELLNLAICPPRKNLFPISETSVNSFIKTRIGQAHPVNSSSSASSLSAPLSMATSQKVSKLGGPNYGSQQAPGAAQPKQRIYTIKDNHRHVIVIYPDKGCLSVWDIYEERAVRQIHNLDQPRDVRMIDQRKAVVLCNRELRVYDLDSGQLLTKLKGVMNQKMPYFEVFGDNYVIALARNRMYVNMLNLSTGELETTFKVGEDRFLNSLLVSANGGICVCGDETQKPFPLLVWNLNERRLLYDLRLDKHEFITRMSAISEDGHFVVSVCKQIGDIDPPAHILSGGTNNNHNSNGQSPNFIVIYDLSSGTLFKKWKPGLDSCAVAISLSANRSGKVINTMVDNSILIWDLATGSKKHTLVGHSTPADVIRVQNNRIFSMDSTCRDQSLRIWDIESGQCLAVFSPDAPINCCQISIRGDALVCGFAAESRLSTLVLCKNETVGDVVKRNKRRKSSKSLYIFDEPPSRKSSS